MPDESLNTALAVTKDDMAALTPVQRAEIAKRKNANIVTAQIAGTNWGKGLDVATQRAISDWGQRTGIDVTTEIFVLGGSIYLSAQFYINRGIDLIMRGILLDYRQRFINHDPQLEDVLREVLPVTASDGERAELAESQAAARREIRERRDLRIKHGVSHSLAIKAAVLTEIVLVAMPHTIFSGVKWCPHPNSKHNDPVGTDYPQETALTRSARRAWKQVIRQVPEIQRFVIGAEEDAAVTVNSLLEAQAERRAAGPAPESRQIGEGAIPVPEYVRTSAEAATRLTPEQIGRFATAPDPYVARGTELIDDDPFAPKPPAGPVTETLFGTSEPMEPTAEEKAAAVAAEDERIREEDRRILAEEEAADRRRAG